MTPNEGIVAVPSTHGVDDTVDAVRRVLHAKGVTLFAVIDHSGEARKVGLEMPPTKLLIFGDPTAGTPLMVASPSIALDLPLKLLVAEDASGAVWISYSAPTFLEARHGLPHELTPTLAAVVALAQAAAR